MVACTPRARATRPLAAAGEVAHVLGRHVVHWCRDRRGPGPPPCPGAMDAAARGCRRRPPPRT
jgi:hypothetical protein